ncbi:hypothetical protein SGCOL_008544 [Colletotrichum sp. CLE4]
MGDHQDQHKFRDSAYESLGDDTFSRTIDKLRELGADLGKSSVLGSVTSFAFPRARELCTRYATQITCHRDDFERVRISIIPSQDSDGDRNKRLKKFGFSIENAEKEDFAWTRIFSEANEVIGLRGLNDGDNPKLSTFVEDVSKIEVNGPNQNQLIIIDIPGIFHTSTKGLTTENDIVIVRNMVDRYIKDQRTIILAAIPCNVDIASQEALTLAKEIDSEGLRIMGVLTKPDLASERAT